MTVPQRRTITLSEPVVSDGKTITEVTIRKPKVKDLKQMQAAMDGIDDKLDQGVAMAASLTGLSIDAVEELDVDDFTTISEVIADFFPKGVVSATGAPSSPKPPTG